MFRAIFMLLDCVEQHPSHRTHSQCLRVPGHRPATTWVHYTTCCKAQSCAPEDGHKNCPKHVELIGIAINCYYCIKLVFNIIYMRIKFSNNTATVTFDSLYLAL